MAPNEGTHVSPAFDQVLTEHLAVIRSAIIHRANELARQEPGVDPNTTTLRPEHYLSAIGELAPGHEVAMDVEHTGFWHRFADSVSPVTLISAILTIVF